MNRRLVLPVLAVSLCLATTSAMAQLTYTLTGGTFSGSFNGTAFTDASITITGSADPATLINGIVPGIGVNYTFLPFTPTATITDGSTTYSMTIQNEVGRTWGGMTFDSVSFLGFDRYVIGWMDDPAAYQNGDGFAVDVSRAGNFPGATGPASLLGSFALTTTPTTYQTSLGPLVLSSYTSNPGTFSINPVPEASTWIPAGLVLSLGLFTLARRQQHNRTQA